MNLLANWRLIAILSGIIACFSGGWYTHTIWDTYQSNNAEKRAIDDLGKGAANIITDTAKIHKELSNDKDCAITIHSATISKLLY